ncbi:MAG: hypothetical protein KF785_09285 [Gemmatimonadales bacterium]|nr:hypothetical protein [Gemmatimonadales bacterium]
MKRIMTGLLVTMLALPLAAQAPGLPVVNAGVASGVKFGTMVGRGNDGAGSGTTVAVSGSVGSRRAAIGGYLARMAGSSWSDDPITAPGVVGSYRLAGGPLVPVAINLQAGAGRYSTPIGLGGERVSVWQVPVGVGIAWTIPQPAVAIRPWIAPRIQYSRQSLPGTVLAARAESVTTTDVAFGLSGGVAFGLLNGVGIDLAVDRVFDDRLTSKPTTVGVGVSLNLK